MAPSWLSNKVSEAEHQEEQLRSTAMLPVTLPTQGDGSLYSLDAVEGDQQDILLEVMNKVREWIRYANPDNKIKSALCRPFQPMRLTVIGAAGTGKSVLVNTIVTAIRSLFNHNDAVLVAAPTGAAAHNVGGTTIHRMFGINIWKADKEPSQGVSKRMASMLRSTVALIVDECSMISQPVLGAAEKHAAMTAHGGGHAQEDWGGIPIVILVGDDFQLPPTQSDGAFQVVNTLPSKSEQNIGAKANGCRQFLHFSTHVMKLTIIKRQHEAQREYKDILTNTAIDKVTEQQAKKLMSLHMHNFSASDQQKILSKDTMYLFANKQPMQEHNLEQLVKEASDDNPVALIKSIPSPACSRTRVVAHHFDNDSTPTATTICRNARVQLCCRNFNPNWGLYNGALGRVKEIVYREGENPNQGHLPQYVTVEFDSYNEKLNPIWSKTQSKVNSKSKTTILIVCNTDRHITNHQTIS